MTRIPQPNTIWVFGLPIADKPVPARGIIHPKVESECSILTGYLSVIFIWSKIVVFDHERRLDCSFPSPMAVGRNNVGFTPV